SVSGVFLPLASITLKGRRPAGRLFGEMTFQNSEPKPTVQTSFVRGSRLSTLLTSDGILVVILLISDGTPAVILTTAGPFVTGSRTRRMRKRALGLGLGMIADCGCGMQQILLGR